MRDDLKDDARLLPAFPCGDFVNDESPFYGITIRDYLAAAALPAIILSLGNDCDEPLLAASHAYEVADAMLAERAK